MAGQLSVKDRTHIALAFAERGKSVIAVQRWWKRKHGVTLSKNTIKLCYERLRDTGKSSNRPGPAKLGKTKLPQNIEAVKTIIDNGPGKSTREVSRECDMSYSSVFRIQNNE